MTATEQTQAVTPAPSVAGRYFSLSESQKLALTSDELMVAVKLEAIHRGIQPPITLENALKQSEARGFSIPPDAVIYYEIVVPNAYGQEGSGLAFKTEAEARKAMEGAFGIYEDGYGDSKRTKLGDVSKFTVRQAYLSVTKPKSWLTTLEEFYQDNSAFDAVCEECRSDLSAIRQREYDTAVTQQKRREYMELARGNLEIAQAFWAKAERTPFPAEADRLEGKA